MQWVSQAFPVFGPFSLKVHRIRRSINAYNEYRSLTIGADWYRPDREDLSWRAEVARWPRKTACKKQLPIATLLPAELASRQFAWLLNSSRIPSLTARGGVGVNN